MLFDPVKWAEPKTDDVGFTLLLAADEMERRGWCQYEMTDSRGRVCLMGAVKSAVIGARKNYDDYHEARLRLAAFLHCSLPENWNDNPERTKEQALEALRAAAWS